MATVLLKGNLFLLSFFVRDKCLFSLFLMFILSAAPFFSAAHYSCPSLFLSSLTQIFFFFFFFFCCPLFFAAHLFSGVLKTKTKSSLRLTKTLRLENEENNPKPSIWLTLLGPKDQLLGLVRRRVNRIVGFGLLTSFSSLRVLGVLGVLVNLNLGFVRCSQFFTSVQKK